MKTLEELRDEITRADEELLRVFDRRLKLVAQVADAKAESGASVYDPAREEIVLANARRNSNYPDAAVALAKTIMRLSRERQYDYGVRGLAPAFHWHESGSKPPHSIQTAAFGGTTGSFSEVAAHALFPNARHVAAPTFAEACDCVARGECDVAVLPVANTSGGTVDTVFRLLQGDLHIVRSIELHVRHCLAVLPCASLGDVATVLSHPQALTQCSNAIRVHNWKTEPVENTAFAARDVARRGDKTLAAICSEEAALAAGLRVVCDNLCDTVCNRTRFIAVAREPLVTPDASRLTLLLHLPHTVGALANILAFIADRGLNLAAISSHPIPEKPWEYAFFLDVEAPVSSTAVPALLRQLSEELPFLRVVGWYKVEK